ncbi:L-cysteine:1D-myo-inositol 2-amino-2-deoxy-alpha-D-glucopyranoside ligase [subsurface metagenome]
MSKSKGNIYYIDTLLEQGYEIKEIRFFLIYGYYRQRLNYSNEEMSSAVDKLRKFREMVHNIGKRAGHGVYPDGRVVQRLKQTFADKMDNCLDVRGAFDDLYKGISEIKVETLEPGEASGIISALREIDGVLKVIFWS